MKYKPTAFEAFVLTGAVLLYLVIDLPRRLYEGWRDSRRHG